jgi:cell division protein FtsB
LGWPSFPNFGKGASLFLRVLGFEFWVLSGASELKTQNSKLKTQNSKLKTQNSKLKTQNSKLKTQNSKLKTQNSKKGPLSIFKVLKPKILRGLFFVYV